MNHHFTEFMAQYAVPLCGALIFWVWAILWLITGKAPRLEGGYDERRENPLSYWFRVGLFFVGGVAILLFAFFD